VKRRSSSGGASTLHAGFSFMCLKPPLEATGEATGEAWLQSEL
jgi:hypothetical protein